MPRPGPEPVPCRSALPHRGGLPGGELCVRERLTRDGGECERRPDPGERRHGARVHRDEREREREEDDEGGLRLEEDEEAPVRVRPPATAQLPVAAVLLVACEAAEEIRAEPDSSRCRSGRRRPRRAPSSGRRLRPRPRRDPRRARSPVHLTRASPESLVRGIAAGRYATKGQRRHHGRLLDELAGMRDEVDVQVQGRRRDRPRHPCDQGAVGRHAGLRPAQGGGTLEDARLRSTSGSTVSCRRARGTPAPRCGGGATPLRGRKRLAMRPLVAALRVKQTSVPIDD